MQQCCRVGRRDSDSERHAPVCVGVCVCVCVCELESVSARKARAQTEREETRALLLKSMADKTRDSGNEAAPVTVTVRAATRDDMPRVHQMIRELAKYEGMPDGPELSVDDLIRDGFDSSPAWFFALIAECAEDRDVVGYALCNRAYSSWTRRAFYIEDLYVQPRMRRAGVGLHLLHRICQMAVIEGVHRVDWHVLESNAPALSFYARLGARDLCRSEARTAMRLDRHRILALAESATDDARHHVSNAVQSHD